MKKPGRFLWSLPWVAIGLILLVAGMKRLFSPGPPGPAPIDPAISFRVAAEKLYPVAQGWEVAGVSCGPMSWRPNGSRCSATITRPGVAIITTGTGYDDGSAAVEKAVVVTFRDQPSGQPATR